MITVPIHPLEKKKKPKNVVNSGGNCVEKSGLTQKYGLSVIEPFLCVLCPNLVRGYLKTA